MNKYKNHDQSLLIDLLITKSKEGDPNSLFKLGKILWGRNQINVARFCLNEAAKKGHIEAENFLNTIDKNDK